MSDQHTPDSWIERQPIDDGPQDEDRCPVCLRIDCDCQAESMEKRCPACNGTGQVINMGVMEDCPMCDDECLSESMEPNELTEEPRLLPSECALNPLERRADGDIERFSNQQTLFDIACQTAKAHDVAIRAQEEVR